MSSGNTWSFYPSQAQNDADLRAELSRLRAENQSLVEELAQTQSDKEFVWSLWKRLQVASPDITQAVGMVVEREKEKAELKDRKVLDILQLKDSKIEELQRTLSEQSREISSVLARKSELQDDNRQMKDEVEILRNKVNSLDSGSRSRDELHEQRIQGLQQDRRDFESRNRELEDELSRLKREHERLESAHNTEGARIKALEDDLHEVGLTYDKLVKEHDEAKSLLQQYERDLDQYKRDTEHKNKELESVRRELSELWQTHQQTAEQASQQVELITQLQELQRDTHQMMKNHEDAFSLENASIKNMQDELKMQCCSLQAREEQLIQKCTDQEHLILELEKELEDLKLHNKSIGTQASFADSEDKAIQGPGTQLDAEYQVDSLGAEVKALRTRLREKNRVIQRLGAMDDDMTLTSDIQPLSSTPKKGQVRRARSLSPGRLKRTSASKPPKDPKTKLHEANSLLKLKTAELHQVRTAHDKRLERLRALQQEYRLLKQQHRALEEEQDRKPKKKKITRVDPKSLRKEDTDTVWNELAYFKKEHKKLLIEKMNLEEEVDLLRVQTKQDAATVYELKACLEHEREETKFLLEEAGRPASPEPDPQLQQLKYQLKQSEAENQRLSEDCQQLVQEEEEKLEQIRSLKAELSKSKQKVSEKRIEITDLKKEVHRLQREIKRRKRKGPVSTLGKQYQKVLNKSITEMRQRFGEFDKEGWEDINDDSEPVDSTEVVDTTSTCNTSGTVGTRESLGQDIVRSARQAAGTSSPARHGSRQSESVDNHVFRLKQKQNEIKSRADKISEIKVPRPDIPEVRHMATSPVHFEAETGRERKAGGLLPMAKGRQLSTLRQRINSLQQQVRILKTCKSTSTKTISVQKVQIETLQSDLSLANQRLQSTRLMLQRLSAEVEREKEAKESLERQLDETQTTESLSTTAEAAFRKTEEEWTSLQTRLRISTSEVTKQLTAIKEQKAEKNSLEDKVSHQQERISHLERDVNQKRSLLEDQKVKLKIAQQTTSVDTAAVEELESKVRVLTETNTRQKTQLESMKQRLQAVTREKHEQEERTRKLAEELDRKMKQMSDLQKKCSELQRSLAEVEEAARQQLHGLARQSEAAIDTAQGKLAQAGGQVDQFHKFVKTLAHELLSSVQQLRQLLRQRQQVTQKREKKPEVSMARAQDMAKEILNLSQSDLEDFMFGADEQHAMFSVTEEEMRKDKKWSHRCAKLLTAKECFAVDLVDLLMQKVEEKCSLTSKLGVT